MTDAKEKLRWALERNTTLQEDVAYSLFGIFDIHPLGVWQPPPKIVVPLGDITALGNAESLFQRYMSGMIEPLVRSACLTEPLISRESTAKVPEVYPNPLLTCDWNPVRFEYPCTFALGTENLSAYFRRQHGTYSRRRYCDVFPLSIDDPHMMLWQALTADSESPWSLPNPDSRGSPVARQGAILQTSRLTSDPILKRTKKLSLSYQTATRLNSSCKQHSKPTLISPQDGTHHTQCHVMLQQQTAATAAPALHTSIALRTPNPANKGQYDG